MSAPSSHYALVGPLWAELERVLHNSGAKGLTASRQIRSLKGRLNRDAIRRLDDIRNQRNRLVHFPWRPLRDTNGWERDCRMAISDIRRVGTGTSACHSVHKGHPPYASASLKTVRVPRGVDRSDTDLPVWLKIIVGGCGAYVILTNESLTAVAGLGLIAWIIASIFFKR